jgi:PKD repeat protein
MVRILRLTAVLLALTGSACTVQKSETPSLAGPSELAISLTMFANPDILSQDGVSESHIVIQARDPMGQPVRNMPIRVDVTVGSTPVDFGLLSLRNLSTGGDGRATVTYTAPPAPPNTEDLGTVVTIMATPTGSDFRGATPRTVDIRLVPSGVILPPNSKPSADFSVSPSAPTVGTWVHFDGSLSRDDGVIVDYAWTFGDGGGANGRNVAHLYQSTGEYSVTLVVTDDRGLKSDPTTKKVSVGGGTRPTASFVYSPANPMPGQDIFFNAEPSSAGAGRHIVSYEWDFGSGRYGSGVIISKAYNTAGTYNVTLTVTDDAGQKGSVTREVKVGTSSP